MPVLRYAVPKLVSENQDRILKQAGLSDAGEWDYQRVREQLVGNGRDRPGFIRVYRDWQDLGEVSDPRTGKRVTVEFKPSGKVPLQDGRSAKGMRAMSLNQKTLDWLALSIEFNEAAFRAINAVKGLPRLEAQRPASVSELVTQVLNDSAKEVLVQADLAEIGH